MLKTIVNTLTAILATIDAMSRTSQKTIDLVEKEVDNLHGYQDIRLTKNQAELTAMRRELEAL